MDAFSTALSSVHVKAAIFVDAEFSAPWGFVSPPAERIAPIVAPGVERLRLGDRLRVDWQLDDLPTDAQVPALILQPLLENAVYHGIEPLEKGGTIRIAGRRDGRRAVITIDNPVPQRVVGRRTGHRIGLDNVRQRLELMYPGEADVEVIEAPEHFIVTLRFPAQDRPA